MDRHDSPDFKGIGALHFHKFDKFFIVFVPFILQAVSFGTHEPSFGNTLFDFCKISVGNDIHAGEVFGESGKSFVGSFSAEIELIGAFFKHLEPGRFPGGEPVASLILFHSHIDDFSFGVNQFHTAGGGMWEFHCGNGSFTGSHSRIERNFHPLRIGFVCPLGSGAQKGGTAKCQGQKVDFHFCFSSFFKLRIWFVTI